mgnify:CR=1 FL=1
MIQRIQTLYMSLSLIISIVLMLFWDYCESEFSALCILFVVSAGLAIFSILSYKKRQNQFVINRINIILNLIILGLFVYQSLSLSGEGAPSKKGIETLLPAISVIFLVLANKAIKKDEDLVKSVDRLR